MEFEWSFNRKKQVERSNFSDKIVIIKLSQPSVVITSNPFLINLKTEIVLIPVPFYLIKPIVGLEPALIVNPLKTEPPGSV